jgi:hypothetical protein
MTPWMMTRSSGRWTLSGMNPDSAPHPGRLPVCYRIVVRGEMTERFVGVLDGIVVEYAGGESVLRVEDADPARLQSILGWLYEHGVELVSVRRAD